MGGIQPGICPKCRNSKNSYVAADMSDGCHMCDIRAEVDRLRSRVAKLEGDEGNLESEIVERTPTCPGDGDLLLAIEKLLNWAEAPTHFGDPVTSNRLSIVERTEWMVKKRVLTNNEMLGMLGVKENLLCGLAEIEDMLRNNGLWLDEGIVESVKNVIAKVVISRRA